MARRNPMNERYQKHTAPAGKTRKSAASAKPKRAAEAPGSKPSTKSGSGRQKSTAFHPTTPEYKRLRTVWWGLMAAAIALSAVAWFLWQSPQRRFGNYALFVGYGFIAVAIWLDWTKLRPLRLEWMKQQKDKS